MAAMFLGCGSASQANKCESACSHVLVECNYYQLEETSAAEAQCERGCQVHLPFCSAEDDIYTCVRNMSCVEMNTSHGLSTCYALGGCNNIDSDAGFAVGSSQTWLDTNGLVLLGLFGGTGTQLCAAVNGDTRSAYGYKPTGPSMAVDLNAMSGLHTGVYPVGDATVVLSGSDRLQYVAFDGSVELMVSNLTRIAGVVDVHVRTPGIDGGAVLGATFNVPVCGRGSAGASTGFGCSSGGTGEVGLPALLLALGAVCYRKRRRSGA